MRLCKIITLALFLCVLIVISSATFSYALQFKVIMETNLLKKADSLFGFNVYDLQKSEEAVYGVDLPGREIVEDQTYSLDPDTGIITFGDGLNGLIPPTGQGVSAAAYRHGGGSEGQILGPLEISPYNLPIFITLDDTSTSGVEETEIRFFLFGITSFDFEVTENGVWVTSLTSIPEPTTMLLLGSGLLGLAGFRRR